MQTPRGGRTGRTWIELLAVAAVMLVTRSSFADHYVVPSGSMRPTVEVGDHVCVSKAAYGLRAPFSDHWLLRYRSPAREEVVVLRSPETDDVLLKRVVAVGGDEVAVKDGLVTIDGVASPTQSLRLASGGGPDFGPTRVPLGHVLVMGDHRGDSHDGRAFGFIPEERIFGRAASVCIRGALPAWSPL